MDRYKKLDITNKIKEFIDNKDIYIDEPMSNHTTFRIGGNVDIFLKIRNIEQIKNLVKLVKEENILLKIIGNGSNILVRDEGFDGIIAKIAMDSYEFIDEETIKVASGMLNAKLAKILLDKELTGFEFAAGIPGTVGGAIKMNAGAYGGEISNLVVSSTYIDLDDEKLELKEINKEEHNFSYRKSFVNSNIILIDTILKLTKGKRDEIDSKMKEFMKSRIENQPLDKPSAGSTFKRGDGFITAKLIDELGLKGYRVGNAQISEKHAGFVINLGGAKAVDVINLTNLVKEKVLKKIGKRIELEIEII